MPVSAGHPPPRLARCLEHRHPAAVCRMGVREGPSPGSWLAFRASSPSCLSFLPTVSWQPPPVPRTPFPNLLCFHQNLPTLSLFLGFDGEEGLIRDTDYPARLRKGVSPLPPISAGVSAPSLSAGNSRSVWRWPEKGTFDWEGGEVWPTLAALRFHPRLLPAS